MKKRLLAGLAVGAAILGMTGMANATNILTNGSFESPVVTDHGGTWQLFSGGVTGWINADDIEIQSETLFGSAADGKQYVELDSNTGDTNNWLVQTFDTTAGQEYIFSFAYSPREGVENNDLYAGVVSYYGGGHWLTFTALSANGSNLKGTNWTYYSYSFMADYASATIAFKDAGPDDSYGTFIDDVSVAPVPEPTTMLLFGTGIAGLAAVGRRRRS